ncbi:MAG: thiol:disulfide interchange protein DsbA/DsbL [Betaproteobacteria bacterium]|nr:thiol:disulfide interchange protein DsbA/DsbL [Betaproteobacteria bacterium]
MQLTTQRLFASRISAWIGTAFLALLAFALPASAQTLGKDYTLVEPPQATETPGKIEVIEFFSYGCPHCKDFHPLVTAWAAKQSQDVVFKRVPVTFGRAAWTTLGKLYYALETSGDLAKLDGAVFHAIHEDRTNLFDDRSIIEWVHKQGADPKKFSDAYSSFTVNSKMARAEQLARAYKVDGVPMVVVDGKYVVKGQSFQDVLNSADQLIAKVRSENGAKGKKK